MVYVLKCTSCYIDKANKFPDSFYIMHEDFTQVRAVSVPLIYMAAVVEYLYHDAWAEKVPPQYFFAILPRVYGCQDN